MRAALLTIALVGGGCDGGRSSTDVVGPFTGAVQRFVVDDVTLPIGGAQQTAFGDDLDGDGIVDNQFGRALTLLDTAGDDLNAHALDIIAAGVLASSVEIRAHALDDDPRVGVTYLGADGEPATPVGGRFTHGSFRGNPTRTTRVPGAAIVHLPVFADADPIVAPVIGLSIDLEPDGAGGYLALIRGGIPEAAARDAAFVGMTQMILTNPTGHLPFARLLDTDRDGAITRAEYDANDLVASLLYADTFVDQGGREPVISLGYRVHLTPCAAGRCSTRAPDACFDRARDAAEADVDCGGACGARCQAGATCGADADCQSNRCATTCAAPTCSDGVRDGLESDVDCGANCAPCAVGLRCAIDLDCASGRCDATGSCTP